MVVITYNEYNMYYVHRRCVECQYVLSVLRARSMVTTFVLMHIRSFSDEHATTRTHTMTPENEIDGQEKISWLAPTVPHTSVLGDSAKISC